MSERTFVVIFFFWAVLTIITPTLVHLSETAKSKQQSNVKKTSEDIKARRMMMGYVEKPQIFEKSKVHKNNITQSPTPAPAQAPAPGPGQGPAPMNRKVKAYLSKVLSHSMNLVKNNTRLNVI